MTAMNGSLTTTVSSEPSSSSHVRRVLEEAVKDLDNAQLPLGFISNPVRNLFLKPALGVATGVLPAITGIIPFADDVTAFGLDVPFNVMRFGYGIIHHDGQDAEGKDTTDNKSKPHNAYNEASLHFRHMWAEKRLSKFVADEIKKNAQVATSDELAANFVKELDGSFTLDNITITSRDGAKLAAMILQPVLRNASGAKKLPTIIFVNSWTFTEHEYIVQAAKFAKRGYIVMCYCTRGFGKSEGKVNVAGPKDQQDMGAVLDWLELNTRVDINNIGIAGISYGAGLSLIGAATQDRIKTAVSMAGWGDLVASLYGNETPRRVWSLGLIGAGYFGGDMDPCIAQKVECLFKHEHVDEVCSWGAERSAITYIDKINAKNKPIYLSNSFSDDLFNPNQALEFFERLTCPKRLDFNQGIHGTPEFAGVMGLPNYVWDNASDWFDHFLKGINTGVVDTQITMELKLTHGREEFSAWPSTRTRTKQYFLKPRGMFSNGKLSSSENTDSTNTTIYSGLVGDNTLTTGIPFLSGFAESHLGQAVTSIVGGVNRFKVAVYYADEMKSTLKIRGHVRLNLLVSSSTNKAHMVVYLHDVNAVGLSRLITHGTVTLHDLTPKEETSVSIELQATAYNVPAGHRLAIAVDTHDPLYVAPTYDVYTLTLCHPSNYQSMLELQCVD